MNWLNWRSSLIAVVAVACVMLGTACSRAMREVRGSAPMDVAVATSSQNALDGLGAEARGAPTIQLVIRAAFCGRAYAIRELLAMPCGIRQRTAEGIAPIEFAALAGRTDVIQEFCKIDPEMPILSNEFGWTPLHFAAIGGSEAALVALCEAYPSAVHRLNCNGRSPMHLAALSGDRSLVELLAGHGGDATQVDRCGLSALAYLQAIRASPALFGAIPTHASIEATIPAGHPDEAPVLCLLKFSGFSKHASRLEMAIWKDGAVAVVAPGSSGSMELFVGMSTPELVDAAIRDMQGVGVANIAGQQRLGMHGGGRRLIIRNGPVEIVSELWSDPCDRWEPECTDPRGAWLTAMWQVCLRIASSVMPGDLRSLTASGQVATFRGYVHERPSDTWWAIVP